MSDSAHRDQPNADQAEYWNSDNGQTWVTHQDGLDKALDNPGMRLLERAAPCAGEHVLDIGCGAGATAFFAAERVGADGRITGLDISEVLLSHARGRNRFETVEFLLADAQTHPFTPDSYDLVISRFGVMFFGDPVAAFTNLKTALKPGGRLHAVAWAPMAANPWFKAPLDFAVARYGPPEPAPPRAPGPMAFQETAYVEEILEAAGFQEIAVEIEDVPLIYKGALEEAAALASQVGPAARLMKAAGGGAQDIAAITQQVAEAFRPFIKEGVVQVPAQFNFLSAIKG